MRESKVAVIGMGVVGGAVAELFDNDVVAYDVRGDYCRDAAAVNACEVAFVAVPTPPAEDGSCDVSIVEEVVDWLDTERIVLCSTVEPATTDRLRRRTGKRIVFWPEYIGETSAHPFGGDVRRAGFVVLGGPDDETSAVADVLKPRLGPEARFVFCEAVTAELAKYMENVFFAAKVTFVNEFYDIARAFGVDFNRLREVWLADRRISPDHTDVYPAARGFDGKCLPKDLAAIIRAAARNGCHPQLLRSVETVNRAFRQPSRPGIAPRPHGQPAR